MRKCVLWANVVLLIIIEIMVVKYSLFPPLHLLAAQGRTDLLEKRLLSGADVDYKSGYFYTPLYAAIINGQEASSKILLAHGANPNSDDYVEPILNIVIQKGLNSVIEELIKHGACLDRKTYKLTSRDPPLLIAVLWDNAFAVELLLAHGADPYAKYSNGPSPYEEAQKKEALKSIFDKHLDDR